MLEVRADRKTVAQFTVERPVSAVGAQNPGGEFCAPSTSPAILCSLCYLLLTGHSATIDRQNFQRDTPKTPGIFEVVTPGDAKLVIQQPIVMRSINRPAAPSRGDTPCSAGPSRRRGA